MIYSANIKAMKGYIEKGWTQDAEARDKFGNDVTADSIYATAWSLDGAMVRVFVGPRYKVFYENSFIFAQDVIHALKLSSWGNMVNWNDKEGRTQSDVISLLDKAIEHLEHEESLRKKEQPIVIEVSF